MTQRIDRDKLHAALAGLDEDVTAEMLADALDLLPPAKLAVVVGRWLDLAELRPDPTGPHAARSLLTDIQAFDVASRAGRYYESFNVNSRNFREQSAGTRRFIAECNRLFGRCVALAPTGDVAEVGAAFDILIKLMHDIDEDADDIVFFADEGGSWQVGVDWEHVLPAWFGCLAQVAAPEDYARRVVATVDEFEEYHRDMHFAAARRCANAGQVAALAALLAVPDDVEQL